MSVASSTVLLTDRAWPDDRVERAVISDAGFILVDGGAGRASTASAADVEELVLGHQPAAIMTCWAPVTAAAIASAPGLRVVARLGVGLDNIAVPAATDLGVLVTNVPDYCVPEVSDHAVAMILAWTRGLLGADRAVRAGRWATHGLRLRRLATLTCGIVGFGRIGQATAGKLAAFGARVLVTTPHPPGGHRGVEFCDLPALLAACDVVVLHAPLTPATRHLIGAAELARMPAGGLLVNVSRGGLVDIGAVVAALASGQLSGAALDVLEDEPNVPAELLTQPGLMITPHIAFASDVSLVQLRRTAAAEVVRVLRGERPHHPRNTVAPGSPATAA